MSINKVFLYLLFEVLVSFTLSSLFSLIIYFTFLFLNSTSYPVIYYIKFAGTTTLSTFIMLIAASVFIKHKVEQDTISSLLRIVE